VTGKPQLDTGFSLAVLFFFKFVCLSNEFPCNRLT